jgi:pyrroline-5-carboxylate reductase
MTVAGMQVSFNRNQNFASIKEAEKMFKGKKIAIIGGGKMGSILAQGLISRKILPANEITVTDIDAARLDYLRSTLKLQASSDNKKTVKNADIIILAVKPQNMAATLKEISSVVDKSKVVISIAAGITRFLLKRYCPRAPEF